MRYFNFSLAVLLAAQSVQAGPLNWANKLIKRGDENNASNVFANNETTPLGSSVPSVMEQKAASTPRPVFETLTNADLNFPKSLVTQAAGEREAAPTSVALVPIGEDDTTTVPIKTTDKAATNTGEQLTGTTTLTTTTEAGDQTSAPASSHTNAPPSGVSSTLSFPELSSVVTTAITPSVPAVTPSTARSSAVETSELDTTDIASSPTSKPAIPTPTVPMPETSAVFTTTITPGTSIATPSTTGPSSLKTLSPTTPSSAESGIASETPRSTVATPLPLTSEVQTPELSATPTTIPTPLTPISEPAFETPNTSEVALTPSSTETPETIIPSPAETTGPTPPETPSSIVNTPAFTEPASKPSTPTTVPILTPSVTPISAPLLTTTPAQSPPLNPSSAAEETPVSQTEPLTQTQTISSPGDSRSSAASEPAPVPESSVVTSEKVATPSQPIALPSEPAVATSKPIIPAEPAVPTSALAVVTTEPVVPSEPVAPSSKAPIVSSIPLVPSSKPVQAPSAPVEDPLPSAISTTLQTVNTIVPTGKPNNGVPSQITERPTATTTVGTDVYTENLARAKRFNKVFAELTPQTACTPGQAACIDGKIAECNANGAFDLTKCYTEGFSCFALPMKTTAGVNIACEDPAVAKKILGIKDEQKPLPVVTVTEIITVDPPAATEAGEAPAASEEPAPTTQAPQEPPTPSATQPTTFTKSIKKPSDNGSANVEATSAPGPNPSNLVLTPIDEDSGAANDDGIKPDSASDAGAKIDKGEAHTTTQIINGTPTVSVYFTVTVTDNDRATVTVTKKERETVTLIISA